MNKVIAALILFTVFISCQNSPLKLNPKKPDLPSKAPDLSLTSIKYKKIEIYCFCFELLADEKGSGMYSVGCGNVSEFKIKNIIKPKHYYDSVLNPIKIEHLVNFIFKNAHTSEPASEYPPSRFVLLLKKDNNTADTVSLNYDESFNINGKELFRYPCYVMDTVRFIIGKKTISCDLPPHRKITDHKW